MRHSDDLSGARAGGKNNGYSGLAGQRPAAERVAKSERYMGGRAKGDGDAVAIFESAGERPDMLRAARVADARKAADDIDDAPAAPAQLDAERGGGRGAVIAYEKSGGYR